MPESFALTPANTTSRTAGALVGASATLKIAQQAVQSVPIAGEIIGIITHIIELADKVDKNNEALRGLADKAAAFARDVDDSSSHARILSDTMTQRLERLRKLYVEEMTPHDGQFMQLRDCQVKKVDVIMKQETEHGTVVYLKARVDGVNELMVVRVCVNCPAIAERSRDDCDSKIVDLIATVSPSSQESHNVASKCRATIRAQYAKSSYAVHGTSLSSFLSMSASAHLEDLGIIWFPESSDALVVDDYGQPTVGAFDDLVSIGLLPRQRQVLAITSLYTAVRRLTVPSSKHSEEVGSVDDCHDATLKACFYAARGMSSQVDTIWEMLREKEFSIQIWKEALPIVDLSTMSPSVYLQGENYWRMLVKRSSWPQYIRSPASGTAYPHGIYPSAMESDELKGSFECFYIRQSLMAYKVRVRATLTSADRERRKREKLLGSERRANHTTQLRPDPRKRARQRES
ncbi:hypothetical protein EXIGLDRAFT_698246 [Exidia glandulosa HHB12029]|uniref:Uncharacterized protein n=1 Tax=Exidia glandulosa HHB12029 TaxID=1314781 RepID=A0A165ECJ1_EXIGL|nr:hypothetical protein EXIGLDRAFT_698246 [Exidia glandulosa HHB12029]